MREQERDYHKKWHKVTLFDLNLWESFRNSQGAITQVDKQMNKPNKKYDAVVLESHKVHMALRTGLNPSDRSEW